MMIEYVRVRGDVKPPIRANPSDAGLDVFFCPDDAAVGGITIQAGGSAILATGLRFGVPHGYMLEVKNRSGMAAKKNLVVGACVVDSGYSGEIFVNLHNVGKTKKLVQEGDKIAQLVLVPVIQWRACEVHEGELYTDPLTISNRGSGALGSTGE